MDAVATSLSNDRGLRLDLLGYFSDTGPIARVAKELENLVVCRKVVRDGSRQVPQDTRAVLPELLLTDPSAEHSSLREAISNLSTGLIVTQQVLSKSLLPMHQDVMRLQNLPVGVIRARFSEARGLLADKVSGEILPEIQSSLSVKGRVFVLELVRSAADLNGAVKYLEDSGVLKCENENGDLRESLTLQQFRSRLAWGVGKLEVALRELQRD